MTRIPGRALLLTLLLGSTARPCGGPGGRPIDAPLLRPHEYAWWFTSNGDDFDVQVREELRFLHPLAQSDSARMRLLMHWSYRGGDFDIMREDSTQITWLPRIDGRALDSLVSLGDLTAARRVAESVVQAVLDLPAAIGDRYSPQLRRAVEVLETADLLRTVPVAELALAFRDTVGSQSGVRHPALREILEIRRLARDSMAAWAVSHPSTPRRASLEFVGLQQAMKRGIPDGYVSDVAKRFSDSTKRALDEAHATWLARHRDHPLADLVRLSRVRLMHFAGQDSLAWNALFEIYPRRLPRVANEMRYIVMTSGVTPSIDDPRLDDGLRVALVGSTYLPPEKWSSWWGLSERVSSPDLRASMQERLLHRLVEDGAEGRRVELPAGFPSGTRGPTRLWGELRMIALMQADSFALALAQSEALPLDSTTAPVRANLLLRAGRWNDALGLPFVEPWSKRYIVRLLAPDSVLETVSRGRDAMLRSEAGTTAALRARSRDGWRAGLALGTLPPAKAALWRTAATMEADASRAGTLRYARWLGARGGQLFLARDKWWFRSLNWRRSVLSDTTGATRTRGGILSAADEKQSLESLLLASEHYLALDAYRRWLDGAAPGPYTRSIVREADRLYNGLVNYDPGNSEFWSEQLERTGIGTAIRRAGRTR